MKIKHISAVGLRDATPEGGWSEEIDKDECVHTLLAVHTDEGVTGLGSVFTSDALVFGALGVLEKLYRDENALEPERVTEKLRQHTFWQGRGGSIEHTISGIDIALWDIPLPLRDHLLALKAQGFRAFKMGWGPFGRVSNDLDETIVRVARETVGEECLLMVDAGGSDAFWVNGYKWALRTSYMLADYKVAWFEEPLKPDALQDYIRLRENAPLPISGGEVLTRRQAFLPWLQAGALDIVQPDVTKVGGITESRRIAWMAEDYGVRFIPHGWNTAVGLAADLQLASAFAGTDLVEYITGSPYVDELNANRWQLDDQGMLVIPDEPGLGFELDMDALMKYTRGQSLF